MWKLSAVNLVKGILSVCEIVCVRISVKIRAVEVIKQTHIKNPTDLIGYFCFLFRMYCDHEIKMGGGHLNGINQKLQSSSSSSYAGNLRNANFVFPRQATLQLNRRRSPSGTGSSGVALTTSSCITQYAEYFPLFWCFVEF